jgi:release factor glutamine methyltransferase
LTTRELLNSTAGYLRGYGVATPRLDAELLLVHVLGVERIDLYLERGQALAEDQYARYQELVLRRARERVPVAYLTGLREFWSRPFRVTPDVLIPRPETELLVEVAVELGAAQGSAHALRAAEIGVGSGAVTAAMALELPRARFVAVDCSGAALAVARENLERLGVAGRVTLVRGMGMQALRGAFDLIVSNPPYVPSELLDGLSPELHNEPRLALDGGPDGLVFLRSLVREAPPRLSRSGYLVLELGQGQADTVRELLKAAGASVVETRSDLAGVERVLLARFGEV